MESHQGFSYVMGRHRGSVLRFGRRIREELNRNALRYVREDAAVDAGRDRNQEVARRFYEADRRRLEQHGRT